MSTHFGNGDIRGILQTTLLLREKITRLGELLPCTSEKDECNPCASVHDCQRKLDAFFEELLGFMDDHFALESEAMHMLPRTPATRSACEAHHEDHSKLMHQLVSLAKENRPPREMKIAFRQLIGDWLYRHIPTHDAVMLQAMNPS